METTPQNYVPELACGRKKIAQSNHDTFVIPPLRYSSMLTNHSTL